MWEQELQQGWVVRRRVARRLSQEGNARNRTDSGPRSRPAGPTQVCHLTPLPGTAALRSQAPQRSRPAPGEYRPPGVLWPEEEAGGLAKALNPPSGPPPPPGPHRETPASFSGFPGPAGSFLSPRPRLPAAAAPRLASPRQAPGSAIPGRTHLRA